MDTKNTVYLTEDQYCILLSFVRRAAGETYDLVRSPFVDSGEVRALRKQFAAYSRLFRALDSLSRTGLYRFTAVPGTWRV